MIFNQIYNLIKEYEKKVGEKPYVILVQPHTYYELELYVEEAKLKNIEEIEKIFSIPIEMSRFIIQPAIAINKKDYEKYRSYYIYEMPEEKESI